MCDIYSASVEERHTAISVSFFCLSVCLSIGVCKQPHVLNFIEYRPTARVRPTYGSVLL